MTDEVVILIISYAEDWRYPIGTIVDTRKGRYRVTDLTRRDADNWFVWGVEDAAWA